MIQNKLLDTDNLSQTNHFVTLELPEYQVEGSESVISSWINLLIDSLFKVFGPEIVTVSWLAGSEQFSIQSSDYFEVKELITPIETFRQVLLDNNEISSDQQFEFFLNGEKLNKIKHSKKHDFEFVNVIISLSLDNKKIGYLSIFSLPANGRWRGDNKSLLKSPTEVTSALKFLWNLVTQERDRLDAILNGMIDGVLLIDDKGDILFANKIARKFLGLGSQPYLKIQNLQQAKNIDITSFLVEMIENRYEVLNKIKKVEAINIILGINIQKLHDQNHPVLGWMTILRDVTADWEMDRLRKEFIATITHELHSPLTIISEGVALVLEEKAGKINEDQRRCLTYARDSIGRMDRLIDNLLRITKLEVSEDELDRRKTVYIKRILQKLINSYENRLKSKNISIEQVLPDSTVQIQMDRDKLTQVFINLFENAMKYTKDGGVIKVGLAQELNQITCWVEDSGIGIPQDQQLKIFEKFYRVENEMNHNVPGHGLGLAIVKEIISNYGGKIWVESNEGKGSRFIFNLPIKLKEDEKSEIE